MLVHILSKHFVQNVDLSRIRLTTEAVTRIHRIKQAKIENDIFAQIMKTLRIPQPNHDFYKNRGAMGINSSRREAINMLKVAVFLG